MIPATVARIRPNALAIAQASSRLSDELFAIYCVTGSLTMTITEAQLCLKALAARIRAEGGSLEGWIV